VLPAEQKVENQPDRPNSLQIQISKLTASNTHIEDRFTMADLRAVLEQYPDCDMFHTNLFPNDMQSLASIPKIFHDFANSHVNPYLCSYAFDLVNGRQPESLCDTDLGIDAIQVLLKKNTLKRDMRCDMWGVNLDQVWLEFLGVPTSRTRPVPFVESFPLQLWICQSNRLPDGVVLPSSSSDSITNKSEPERDQDDRKSRKLLKQFYSTDDNTEDSSPSTSTSKGRTKGRTMSSSTTSSTCDIEKPHVQYTSLKVADVNIVAKIGGKVRAQLSNPQYLFLMRLMESITNLQTQVTADMKDFLTANDNAPAMSISLPLVIPEIEFAMVSPYIAELLPLSDPIVQLRSQTPEDSDSKETYPEPLEIDVLDYTMNNNGYMAENYVNDRLPLPENAFQGNFLLTFLSV